MNQFLFILGVIYIAVDVVLVCAILFYIRKKIRRAWYRSREEVAQKLMGNKLCPHCYQGTLGEYYFCSYCKNTGYVKIEG
jgi:hypothetical protein